MDESKVTELKQFVEQCKSDPSVLNDSSLSFFKNYIQSLGGQTVQTPKSLSVVVEPSSEHRPKSVRATKENEGKGKAVFNLVRDQFLIDMCIKYRALSNTMTAAAKKKGWKKVVDKFNARFGTCYIKGQFQDHIGMMKKIYNFIKEAKTLSGFTWDPLERKVIASDEVWDNYIESMSDESNDDIVDREEDSAQGRKPNLATENDDIEDEIVESDIELEGEVVEPDNDPPQKMGDASVEVTDESRDAAQTSKAKAMDAIYEGKVGEAIEYLTEAIILNPSSAILYATRASVFVKMNKPNAAIQDADAALQINPDSAKGYKYRGMARAMLGQWEEAATDLRLASKLDYDEEISSALKKVEPNAHKIEEHRRKYERLRKERELKKVERERQNWRAHAQAMYEKEKKKEHSSENKASSPKGMAGLQEGTVLSVHSANEFENKLNAASSLSRLAVLYFTATWCGPCHFMSPVYAELAGKYPKVVFMKIDIDQLRDVAAGWNISGVPTFFFMKNGKEIDKVVGADKTSLERKIEKYAANS